MILLVLRNSMESQEDDFKKSYKFVAPIDAGSQGKVEKFISNKTGEEVAIKILELSNDEFGEHEIISQLNHENILKPLKIYQKTDGARNLIKMKIVYPLLEMNLKTYIENFKNQNQNIPESQVLKLIYTLTSAMSYLQSKGIAHRDIKPQNILVKNEKNNDGPSFHLIDFGIAKSGVENTQQNTMVGTRHYLSPELAKAKDNNLHQLFYNPIKSDIFSLGLVFLQVLTLEPIKGFNKEKNKAMLQETFKKIANQDLRVMVENILVFDYEKRWTFDVLLEYLNNLVNLKFVICDYLNSGLIKYDLQMKATQTVVNLYEEVASILALKDFTFVLLAEKYKGICENLPNNKIIVKSPPRIIKLPWRDFKKPLSNYFLFPSCNLYLLPISNEVRYQYIVSYFFDDNPLEEIEKRFAFIITNTLESGEAFKENEICYEHECKCTVVPHIKYLDQTKVLIFGMKESILNIGKFYVIFDGMNLKPMKFMQVYVKPLIQEIRKKMDFGQIEDVLKKKTDPTIVFVFEATEKAELFTEILGISIKKLWPNLKVLDGGTLNEKFLSKFQSIKDQIV